MDDYRAEARRRWKEGQGQGSSTQDGPSARTHKASTPVAQAARKATAGNGAAGETNFLDALWQQWSELDPETRKMVFMGLGALLAVNALGLLPVCIITATIWYLRTQLPPRASFEPFFREWFLQDYFPAVSQKLQRELKARADTGSWLNSLADNVRGWMIGKTAHIEATFWYEFAVKFALPPAYKDLYFMRMATLNLGSRSKPSYVTFWGINGRWMLSPMISVDFENVSLLDEMQKQ